MKEPVSECRCRRREPLETHARAETPAVVHGVCTHTHTKINGERGKFERGSVVAARLPQKKMDKDERAIERSEGDIKMWGLINSTHAAAVVDARRKQSKRRR